MAQLANQRIANAGADPRRWLLVGHGIFGRGANWRSIARELCRQRPRWGVILVDLRAHGGSTNVPGPHNLEAAAADVVETVHQHSQSHGPVDVLLGHSFGGKVMLEARALLELSMTWLVDSSPSRDPLALTNPTGVAPAALASLEEVARSFSDGFAGRADLVQALASRGFAPAVGQFLAMNLNRGDDGRYRFGIDLGAIRQLLGDYFDRDLWPEIAQPHSAVRVAVAGQDSALSTADQRRLEGLAEKSPHLRIHHVADAGHWIHADAPTALLELITSSLVELET